MNAHSAPRISVVLPTYNRAHLLGRTLRSLLAQTFRDFEVHIVDDGSTDGTEAVVAEHADPRVHYVRVEHRGCAAARNHAVREARGEWIALLDSDDEWTPDKLERQMQQADTAAPTVGVLYAGGVFIDDTSGNTISVRRPLAGGHGWIFDRLLETHWFPSTSVVARRRCFDEVGFFDERLTFGEDREWLLRVARRFEFLGLDDLLVLVHIHGGPRLTHSLPGRIAFVEVILERYAAELRARPLVAARKHVGLGQLYLRDGNGLQARAAFGAAVRAHPTFVPAYFHYVLSLGPWRMWHGFSWWRQRRRARGVTGAARGLEGAS
jgi:glycosyltransferase involved in cell wall biosynthesis